MTPSAVHVGNIVQGARLAWAQGRDIGMLDEDSDTARKVTVTMLLGTNEILMLVMKTKLSAISEHDDKICSEKAFNLKFFELFVIFLLSVIIGFPSLNVQNGL